MQTIKCVERENQIQPLLVSLMRVFEQSKCQVNMLTGEAGTGKTVLCEMFLERAKKMENPPRIVQSFCGLYSEFSLPYAPFKEILKHLLQIDESEYENKTKSAKILNFTLKKALEIAPDLISTFIPGGSIIAKVGEDIIQEMGLLDKFKTRVKPDDQIDSLDEKKILAQYSEILKIHVAETPILIVIDDFQWADKASINMLYYLSRSISEFPIYILISYRSTEISVVKEGERHLLVSVINEIKRYYGDVVLNLDEISPESRFELLNQIIDKDPNTLNADFRKSLLQITNGNPLFIKEMVSSLIENGEIHKVDGKLTESRLINWQQKPARIEGIIEERISKLEDRLVEVLSYASVQGNRFIAQILSKTLDDNERDILKSLSRKLEKEHHLVREINCYRSGNNIISEFQFSNYIFQHYLYEELSPSQRLLLHGDVADSLELMFSDNIEEVALQVANHRELSGENEVAVLYYLIAVRSIMRVSQFEQAYNILIKVKEIIDKAKDTIDKSLKLDAALLLSICARSIYGWGSEKVIDTYNNVIELGKDAGELKKAMTAQFGMWAVFLYKLELNRALAYAKDFLELSKKLGEESCIVQAKISMANTYFWMNKQTDVMRLIDEIDQMAIDKEDSGFIEKYGQSPQSLIIMFKLVSNLLSGDIVQVEKEKELAEKYIQTQGHLYSKTIVLTGLAWSSYLNFDYENAGKYAAELIKISSENNYKFYKGLGLLFQCWSELVTDVPNDWEERLTCGEDLIYTKEDITLLKIDFQLTKAEHYLYKKEYSIALTIINQLLIDSEQNEEKLSLTRLYYYLALTQNKLNDNKACKLAIKQGLRILDVNSKLNVCEMKLLALWGEVVDRVNDFEDYKHALKYAISRSLSESYSDILKQQQAKMNDILC